MSLSCLRPTVIPIALLALALTQATTAAATDHIRGVIALQHGDGTMSVRTDDATTVTVVLQDHTKTRRVDGMRELPVSSAWLIPGLRVHADGSYEDTSRFIATHITFNRDDQKMALAIKGGIDTTDLRSLDNQRRIDENVKTLEQQRQTLDEQAAEIATNAKRIVANEEELNATTTEFNARFSNLSQYNIVTTMAIYFHNGKATMDADDKAALQRMAARARGMKGYVIQVQGYASAVGPDALNQTLSKKRANAVAYELQQGGVPPNNIAFPAAMGIQGQVASNATTDGQAENRRTVVTLLQNAVIGK